MRKCSARTSSGVDEKPCFAASPRMSSSACGSGRHIERCTAGHSEVGESDR